MWSHHTLKHKNTSTSSHITIDKVDVECRRLVVKAYHSVDWKMGAKTVSDNFSDFARLGMIIVSYFCRFWYVVIVVGLPQTRQRGAQRVSFNHQISEINDLFDCWLHHPDCKGLPGGGVWVTRGGVYEGREMVISSVGVSVAAGLLLRPETVLADVVVELVHAQATGGAGVGSCKGNISVN